MLFKGCIASSKHGLIATVRGYYGRGLLSH